MAMLRTWLICGPECHPSNYVVINNYVNACPTTASHRRQSGESGADYGSARKRTRGDPDGNRPRGWVRNILARSAENHLARLGHSTSYRNGVTGKNRVH